MWVATTELMECSWTVIAPTAELANEYFDRLFPGRRERQTSLNIKVRVFKERYGHLAHTKKYGRKVTEGVWCWESPPYDYRRGVPFD